MARTVEAVLFDYDGTLCDSQSAFTKWHNSVRRYLAEIVGQEYDSVDAQFSDIWREGNRLFYVNPHKLIDHACTKLQIVYPGLGDIHLGQVRQMLSCVYEEPVYLYPEVRDALHGLMAQAIVAGVVTHAPDWWTKKKLEWAGINQFLLRGVPYVVDMDGPKNYLSWLEAEKFYMVNRKTTWIVGDNLTADANAGVQAGFARSYWLNRPNEPTWTVIRDGQKADGVREITSLAGIIEDIGEVA